MVYIITKMVDTGEIDAIPYNWNTFLQILNFPALQYVTMVNSRSQVEAKQKFTKTILQSTIL